MNYNASEYYFPSRRFGVSKTYVETSTDLLVGLDEMIREGYYRNRTEGVNDAIRLLLKQYKLSKLHVKDSMIFGTKSQLSGDAEP